MSIFELQKFLGPYRLLCPLDLWWSLNAYMFTKYFLKDMKLCCKKSVLNIQSMCVIRQACIRCSTDVEKKLSLISTSSVEPIWVLTRSVDSSAVQIQSEYSPGPGLTVSLLSLGPCLRGSGPGPSSCVLSSMSLQCASSCHSSALSVVWPFPWWTAKINTQVKCRYL